MTKRAEVGLVELGEMPPSPLKPYPRVPTSAAVSMAPDPFTTPGVHTGILLGEPDACSTCQGTGFMPNAGFTSCLECAGRHYAKKWAEEAKLDKPAASPPDVIHVAATGAWFPKTYDHVTTAEYWSATKAREILNPLIASEHAVIRALRVVVEQWDECRGDRPDEFLEAIEAARKLVMP